MWPIDNIGNLRRDARGSKFGRKSGAVAGATEVWERASELRHVRKRERNLLKYYTEYSCCYLIYIKVLFLKSALFFPRECACDHEE